MNARAVPVAITESACLPAGCGGKALGLQAICRAGLAPPPAWSVLPDVGREQLDALAAELRTRGVRLVAVRSSGIDEDGAGASFAGIHETRLAVPLEGLADAVAVVARSPLAPRARAYRAQLGLRPASEPCAVVVQAMFDAACAGIAFSRGPNEVVIEAVEGLGELAVNGEVVPGMWLVQRAGSGWDALLRSRRRQRQTVRASVSGIVRVAVEPGENELLSLGVARAIASGLAALETASGRPLDVEWGWRAGDLAFLQARAQTRPLVDALPPGEMWTRANSREVLPELPSALTRSTTTPAVDAISREILARVGMRVDAAIPLNTYVYGRPIVNERGFRPTEALGLSPEWQRITMGGGGALSNALAPPRFGAMLRNWRVLWGLLGMLCGSRRRARRRLEIRRRGRAAETLIDVRALGDTALAGRIDRAQGDEITAWIRCVLHVYMAAAGALFRALSALRATASPTALLAKLLAAEELSTSTRQLEEFVDLANEFRAWPGATTFLSTVGHESTGPEAWREALPASLWESVRAWLERYGHRRPHESDIALSRPAEDPRLLCDALAPLVSAPEPLKRAEAQRERRRRDSAEAWAEVARTNGAWRRWNIRRAVRNVATWSVLREELRSELTKDSLVLRRDLVELARRLVARGQLEASEHIFDLSADELRRAVSDPSYDARTAVQREWARRAAWRRIEVPNRFMSEDVATFAHSTPDRPRASEVMRGLPVSPGEVEARACLVRSPDDGGALEPGGVLVAHATDPAWTPLFARASGIVVELGGLLSHAATVAREYGIPCVANVERATALLRDGDVVRVDGSRGEVVVIARARPASEVQLNQMGVLCRGGP